MWHISLSPDLSKCPTCHEDPMADSQEEAILEAFIAYDLLSVEALEIYFHAAAGYPVRDTWPKEIKVGN